MAGVKFYTDENYASAVFRFRFELVKGYRRPYLFVAI